MNSEKNSSQTDCSRLLITVQRIEGRMTNLTALEVGEKILFVISHERSGTQETPIEAATYVATVEQRQGLKISCPEEIALRMGFIDLKQFNSALSNLPNSGYVQYLRLISAEFT